MELIQLLRSSALCLLIAGCGSADEDCTSTECFVEAAIAEVGAGAPAVNAVVDKVPDVLSRVSVMASVVTARPEAAEWLCDRFPHGISRARCESVIGRAHLWEAAAEAEGPSVRAGSGPVRAGWTNGDLPESTWAQLSGISGQCAGEIDPVACSWGHALKSARDGEAETAARWCAGLKAEQRWRSDCFVQAAEVTATRWGRAGFDDAFALCGAAADFRGLCAGTLLARFAALAPPSSVSDVVQWAPQLMILHSVRALYEEPVARERMEDRYTALMTFEAVTRASVLTGDALDVLPPSSAPHVRAAVSHRLITESSEAMRLDDAVLLVQAVLERRGEGSAEGVGENSARPVVDLWPYDRDGESHLAAVSYLGHSRRTVANDPERDVAICVLEAAARAQPPWQTVLEEAKGHSDERVRWTAVRLVEQLEAIRLGTESAEWAPELDEPTPDL